MDQPGVSPLTGSSDLIADLDALTPTVIAAYSRIEDDRLREIVASVISHLHACVKELNLNQLELRQALDFVNAVGKGTDGRYNGATALSDVLGVSTLVCMLQDRASAGEGLRTTSSVMGPLWREGAPWVEDGGTLIRSATAGPPLFFTGRVLDPAGKPLPDVTVHVWQSTPGGKYENQDDTQAKMNLRGRLKTTADGTFRFRSVLPGGYPASGREPVASVLKVAQRPGFRPAHLHFLMHGEGVQTLVTQIFHRYCPHLHHDAAFGATNELLGDFVEHTGPAPAPDAQAPWYSVEQTFVMVRGESFVPAAPIE